ncbi:MAG: SDR family NAD(P)-dependent oxidoreductase [Candidatus Moranbacteria bacterium]|nr:SDR family NAD(P)-dependent oxidoreductase [Candidatus Moranbacteria bacterium]MDD3965268.1 SDR family NAD(P)-dependent oxidoreductase [Candidatus Moranbacteria bacterium]
MMNKSQGYYYGTYTVSMKPYSGVDFSRRCFIFAGQGSTFPGMFRDEYLKSILIREKFALADRLMRRFHLPKISDYIMHPENLQEKTLPVVSNIALFTLEMALFDMLRASQIIPEKVTGHSFGEYSALVASGVVSFEEMLMIIYHRDIFCPKAHTAGFLIAVNADVRYIKAVLKHQKYFISNINSPNQTVIAVVPECVDEIVDIFRENETKCKVLYGVPQPYHSPYLLSSQKKIEAFLRKKQFTFRKPTIPFFSSVLKKEINQQNFRKSDIEKILCTQITTQVNFIYQVRSMYNLGCFSFLEIGPKKIFSVFVEDILAEKKQSVKTECIQSFFQKEQKANTAGKNVKNAKLFTIICKTIREITGYEIKSIHPNGRFQEDFGIDSIKRTDILLTIFRRLKISLGDDFNTSHFKSIDDVILYIETIQKKSLSSIQDTETKKVHKKRKTEFQRYAFLPVTEELSIASSQCSRDDRANLFVLDIENIFESDSVVLKRWFSFVRRVVDKNQTFTLVIRAQDIQWEYKKMLSLFQFFRGFLQPIKQSTFCCLCLSFGSEQSIAVSSLASFLKSLKREFSGMFFRYVHSDAVKDFKEFLPEKEGMNGDDIVYTRGKRYRMQPVLIQNNPIIPFKKDAVIIVIGGASGITFSLIKHIAKEEKPIFYVIGRRNEQEKIIREHIRILKKYTPHVFYVSLDARDKVALEKVWKRVMREQKRIDYVINGAGTVDIDFFDQKTELSIESEFCNKVVPTLNVLQLALKYHPKRVINFASIISRYGSAGQSIYTAANAWVSEMTQKYGKELEKYGSVATAIHWPAWENTGMTAEKSVSQKLDEYEVSLLDPDDANRLFALDLSLQKSGPVYYLDASDDSALSFPSNNFIKYAPILGSPSDLSSLTFSQNIFRKSFHTTSDKWLRDHKIQGAMYVPLAIGIGMFLCLGKMYWKKVPLLKNISAQNPLIVRKAVVECTLERKNVDNKNTLSLKSDVSYFSAEEIKEEKEEQKLFCIIKKNGTKISKKDIYDFFEKETRISFGPTFQTLQAVWKNEDGSSCAVIDTAKLLPIFGIETFDRLIQWIDASFQMLGLQSADQQRTFVLPISIDWMKYYEEIEKTRFVYPVLLSFTPTETGVRGDVSVVNEKGEVILEMKGIFLRKGSFS